jgi:hypothetical protein
MTKEIFLLCNQFLIEDGMETHGQAGFTYKVDKADAEYLVLNGLATFTEGDKNVKRKKTINPKPSSSGNGAKRISKNRPQSRGLKNRDDDKSGDKPTRKRVR